jgi:hypothetical protein
MQFIGNVLTSHAVAAQHPERDKEHFHITPAEAHALDATGLPVHLEHAGNIKVGHVVRSWNDADGTKWVLADVDTSTIEGKYIQNDLTSATPVYSSLSLQHMYRKYRDGRSTKSGIEVSICKDPRRPGCNIVHSSATDTARYKVCASRQRTMTTAETPTTTVPMEATEALVAEPMVAPAAPSTTQLMAEVVEASRHNTDLQKQLEEKTLELQALNAKADAEKAESLLQQTQMAEKLGNAVLEHVARLDPKLAGEDTERAIATLREKYPVEVARVLEVACAASNHAKDLEEQLAKHKTDTDRKLMEQAYHAAVTNRPGCHGVPDEVPVQASKKARVEVANPFAVRQGTPASRYSDTDSIAQIHEAYGALSHGSTTDAMRDIAGIIGLQRQKGFR